MKKLHPTQKQLLELLKETITDPLTFRDLQKRLNLSSPSMVHHHIRQLEKKGYLRRNPYNPQDYQILSDTPDKKIAYLNLYGLVRCGPNGSLLDGNPVERIPISTKILGFASSDAFLVKAKGDSMSPKINDGDLVIVKRTSCAENGDIVVCVNEGGVMIKKIQKNENIILVSFNPNFEPFVADEDFKVEGVVKGVYSYDI